MPLLPHGVIFRVARVNLRAGSYQWVERRERRIAIIGSGPATRDGAELCLDSVYTCLPELTGYQRPLCGDVTTDVIRLWPAGRLIAGEPWRHRCGLGRGGAG